MAEKPKTARQMAIDALREAEATMRARMPGNPAVAIPLDRIHCFTGDDGETRAVIGVQEVIYLADAVLAEKK